MSSYSRRFATGTIAVTLAVGGLAGCRPGTREVSIPKGAVVVVAQHLRFTPSTVTAKVGQPVVWRFDDQDVPHDVSSTPSGPLHSKVETSGTYEHVFTAPGTYNYECTIHVMDGMIGTVIVTS
jgi:plastocyanin